jgi:integrase
MMATGIVTRHSRRCPKSNGGKTCRCPDGPSYEAWVSVTRNGRPGKVRRTFRRHGDAKAWRGDATGKANRGELRPVRRDTRTVADALAELVEGMRIGTVRPPRRERYKPATIRSYDQAVRRHLADSDLGALRVADVRRSDVQAFADELLADELAPATVANALCVVQVFYRREVTAERLATNPAKEIDIPNGGPRRPKRIASPSEAAALIGALEERDRSLWACAFYAGLRRGELMALRVLDVDLGASAVNVEQGWDQYAGAQEPKTYSSRRTVPLLATLRDYLEDAILWNGRSGTDLIFGREPDKPFAPVTIGKRAAKAWESANEAEHERAEEEGRKPQLLKPLTLHGARHTFASMAIDAGITNAKAIQDAMGHSKIQTTYDLYGHLLPGSRDEMRERMDAYLSDATQIAETGREASLQGDRDANYSPAGGE